MSEEDSESIYRVLDNFLSGRRNSLRNIEKEIKDVAKFAEGYSRFSEWAREYFSREISARENYAEVVRQRDCLKGLVAHLKGENKNLRNIQRTTRDLLDEAYQKIEEYEFRIQELEGEKEKAEERRLGERIRELLRSTGAFLHRFKGKSGNP